MTAVDRLVGREVLAWTAAVGGLALGLCWVTSAVEATRLGPAAALQLGLWAAPGLLLPLLPLLVALGAALAAARLETRGERVALEALGYRPARSGALAAGVGLGLGLLQIGASDALIWRAEARVSALRGTPPPTWVWTEQGAVRPSDGLLVYEEGGALQLRHLDPAHTPPDALARAAQVQRPRAASGDALAGSTLAPARTERLARRVRALAAALAGLLGWLPWSRRPARQVGVVLLGGLGWSALDLIGQAAAAQGRVSPALGAGGAAVILGLLAVWRAGRRQVG